jgi:hypothetical protein
MEGGGAQAPELAEMVRKESGEFFLDRLDRSVSRDSMPNVGPGTPVDLTSVLSGPESACARVEEGGYTMGKQSEAAACAGAAPGPDLSTGLSRKRAGARGRGSGSEGGSRGLDGGGVEGDGKEGPVEDSDSVVDLPGRSGRQNLGAVTNGTGRDGASDYHDNPGRDLSG